MKGVICGFIIIGLYFFIGFNLFAFGWYGKTFDDEEIAFQVFLCLFWPLFFLALAMIYSFSYLAKALHKLAGMYRDLIFRFIKRNNKKV